MLSTDAKRRQTCRTLFETATSDGGKLGTRDQVERLRDDCSRTWNYDFGADRPRQGGRYEWQKMQDGRPGDEAQARRPQETELLNRKRAMFFPEKMCGDVGSFIDASKRPSS